MRENKSPRSASSRGLAVRAGMAKPLFIRYARSPSKREETGLNQKVQLVFKHSLYNNLLSVVIIASLGAANF